MYANLQKQLLLDYELKLKIKTQEWTKFTADKKSLITIIYGQCNHTTRTKIALGINYAADQDTGNIINFLKRLRTICDKSMMVAYLTSHTR